MWATMRRGRRLHKIGEGNNSQCPSLLFTVYQRKNREEDKNDGKNGKHEIRGKE